VISQLPTYRSEGWLYPAEIQKLWDKWTTEQRVKYKYALQKYKPFEIYKMQAASQAVKEVVSELQG